MGHVTKEQIERARQVKVLDYVLSHEENNLRRVGNGYRLKDHESLAVSEKGFYWHSHGIGGKTALDFLTDVRGYGLVDAVCMLLGEKSPEQPITPNAKPPPERRPFISPLRHKDNNRVIAYLQSRGIDKSVILSCTEKGLLYESANYHNAVFVGKDENNKTRLAAIRSTTSSFKRDADGSEKKYGFTLPPDNPKSREIAVLESGIDCLSHQTLCKQGFIPPFDGWRLSLGGTSITALEHFVKQHPEVTHCLICLDNDEAGEIAAAKIAEMPGITTVRVLPVAGNDWNDALKILQKAEHTKSRERDIKAPDL